MNIGLIIFYVLIFLDILISAYKHGESAPNYNLWMALFVKLAITLPLLWWTAGGFI